MVAAVDDMEEYIAYEWPHPMDVVRLCGGIARRR
jgi:hypothetical protein